MARRISWRLISAIGLILALSVFGFALLALLPGDYAEVVLIHQMDGDMPSAGALAAFKAEHGFDRALPLQYAHWLGSVAQGDLGRSFATGDPVLEEVALRLRATLALVGTAFTLTVAVGVPLGILAAVHRGSVLDRVVMAGAVLGMSVPNFWQALLFVLLFSLSLGWLPSSGYGGLSHIVLPATVIATASMGLTARYVRASLIDALGATHVRTALAKGLSTRDVVLSHALPAAMPGLITLIALQAARMFDGAIVVETIFAWPGLGRLFVESILSRDYPVLQATILVVGAAYILIHLAADTLIAWLDPRLEGTV